MLYPQPDTTWTQVFKIDKIRSLKMRTLIFVLAVLAILVGNTYAELPKDIVFLATFDEGKGDTVGDLSGNGNDGTADGKQTWIDGPFEKAFEFDGSTFITIENAGPLKELTDPMSVGAWVNPDGITGWQNIVEMDGGAGWKFGFHGSKVLVWTTYHVKDFLGQTVIAEGEWTHVAATWNGKEAIIYVNGEEDDAGPIAGGGVIDVSGEPSLDIGYRRTSGSSHFVGGMDELWISNEVKSQKEIQEFMDSGFNAILAVDPVDKLAVTWGKLKVN
ncbi:LamG domain-containing protein [Candidatus Poribacteria bacterium]|nr:LamG domain-containing protein [Candidatus Poribacteria bacterium]